MPAQIVSLNFFENIVSQKCLLPCVYFNTKLKPGFWVKCCVQLLESKATYFAVCRAFPTSKGSHQNICYLDECVVHFDNEEQNGSGKVNVQEGRALISVQPLAESEETPRYVDISITVTGDVFAKHFMEKTRPDTLILVVHTLLQSIYLTSDCIVRNPEFLQLGVAAIHVKIIAPKAELTVFAITRATVLNLVNVKLDTIVKPDPIGFCKTDTFCRAHQELIDLVRIGQLNHGRSTYTRRPLNALIVGPAGCGKNTLVNHFMKVTNSNCFRVSANEVIRQYAGETEMRLQSIFRAARTFASQLKPKDPVIILVDSLHLLCPAWQKTSAAKDLANMMRVCAQFGALLDELRQCAASIICIATTVSPAAIHESVRVPGRFDREIVLSAPGLEERATMLKSQWQVSYMASEFGLTPNFLEILGKQTHGYVTGDLALLIRTIEHLLLLRAGRKQDDFSLVVKDALQVVQPASVRGMDVVVTRIITGFEILSGMDALKHCLEISLLSALKRPREFQRLGLTIPKGILLYGPPGCAKTTIAKCLANMANYNFISTSGAEIYSPYVGCAEKMVANIFDTARKNAPCLIFFDEIDTLVGRRSTSGADVQTRILSTFLTEMDGIITPTSSSIACHQHVLVVAATNRPDKVDDALLRPGRFDKLIHVPAPDFASRLSILQLRQNSMPFSSDVDLTVIAARTANYTGADLCNLCNEAAILALQRDPDAKIITWLDFESVLRDYRSSLTEQQLQFYHNFKKSCER